jgi:hypothetical protein
MKTSNLRIIPSQLKYKSAPSVDQKLSIYLNSSDKNLTEYDRIRTVNLAETYNNERQQSTIFRPTFKISYIYNNLYTGTTNYTPFKDNLYFVDSENSLLSGIWKGYPQFYEFDFFRPDANDQHFSYVSKSAYTYNWTYYFSYPFNNNFNKQLSYNLNNTSYNWVASSGIPFKIKNITSNGDKLISFECIAPHGLQISESVEITLQGGFTKLLEVYSLGNDTYDSEKFIFNVYNVGFTGTTYSNNVKGTFKRVINSENIEETKSKYYIREHKILTNIEDVIITKSGFEKNAFNEELQYSLSSLTPNGIAKITKKSSSGSYVITSNIDIDINNLLDNQKRPISELYLTIINKGYSGYFNKPYVSSGLKQGWEFNISGSSNQYWDNTNLNCYTNISASSYSIGGYTFYFNENLNGGDIIDGDFCEWNDYEQTERIISKYYHKINYNQDNFQTVSTPSTNTNGFYYAPHNKLTIRVFSNYIETGDLTTIDQIPSYSFFSQTDQQFRWRDLYLYGFIDELGLGVDYPYLNNSHYPFQNVIFRLIPEGSNVNYSITGINVPIKPIIDGCE